MSHDALFEQHPVNKNKNIRTISTSDIHVEGNYFSAGTVSTSWAAVLSLKATLRNFYFALTAAARVDKSGTASCPEKVTAKNRTVLSNLLTDGLMCCCR